MAKSLDQINATEREIWDENKLERSKVKRIRRHAYRFSDDRLKSKLQQFVQQTFEGKEVLELGSSEWYNWILHKATPKKVTCINISKSELNKGIERKQEANFEVDFQLMDANELEFQNESFDVVYGGAILHHLDIDKTIHHVYRVLKPGGYILFFEPLNMNPFYRLYRNLHPKQRTPDEHALVQSDFKLLRKKFTFEHEFLDFFTVVFGFISSKIFGDKYYGNFLNRTAYFLDVLFSKLPFTYPFFARVIIFGKKKPSK